MLLSCKLLQCQAETGRDREDRLELIIRSTKNQEDVAQSLIVVERTLWIFAVIGIRDHAENDL